VNVWAERPWNAEGKQLDPVFHASIGFTAKFGDFEALARWIELLALEPGVTINDTRWDLTEDNRVSVLADVRSKAVADAVGKATVFAQSIGLSTVTPIAIADPGMLGDRSSGEAPLGKYDMMAMRAGGAGSRAMEFKPEEIEVTASVDARFVAS
jgi:uncharacterized protein YggE